MKINYLLLLLFSWSHLLFGQASDTQHSPNVILIVVDDMGWNDIGYHGSEVKTPTMDSLAVKGVELNRFYVHPACSPTRSALMTGKAAVRLGFVNPLGKNNVKGLPLDEKIMPQYFKENGYSTHLLGKWHLGRFKKEYWPNNRGFDHFYGYLTGGIGHYDHIHGGGLDWQRDGQTLREEGYVTHLLTDEAVKIIQAQDTTKPLFLELCYAAPHMPNEAPKATIAEYEYIDNKNRQIHAAMITEIDRGIQKILKALEANGLMDNTIIWFLSDNGGQNEVGSDKNTVATINKMTKTLGEPLPFPFLEFVRDNIFNGAADNSPLKGGKNSTYEGGVRVPSFIYAPSFLEQQIINHRVTVNDILPTLATATGFKTFDTTNIDGVSQWRFLKKEAAASVNTYVAVSRFNQAYYKEEWKLLLPNEGEAELYKVIEDPTETNNLATQYPKIVQELTTELLAFPRGEPVDDPLWKVFVDPDLFGGKEDRKPFAGEEGKVSGPLHRIFYITGGILLVLLGLIFWLIRTLIKRFLRKGKTKA